MPIRRLGPIARLRGLVCGIACLVLPACGAPEPQAPPPSAPQHAADVVLTPVPFEGPDACPFEGCLYQQWTAIDGVELRADRHADASAVVTLIPGQRVSALTGVVITTRAGRIQFRRQVDLPSDAGAVHVERGQDLQLLSYAEDGYFTAALDGRVYPNVDGNTFLAAACDDAPRRCIGEVVAEPEVTWWVQVRTADGRTGWTSEPEKFDGTGPTAAWAALR